MVGDDTKVASIKSRSNVKAILPGGHETVTASSVSHPTPQSTKKKRLPGRQREIRELKCQPVGLRSSFKHPYCCTQAPSPRAIPLSRAHLKLSASLSTNTPRSRYQLLQRHDTPLSLLILCAQSLKLAFEHS